MADSILRLKVESQEYDNKLKQASQNLTRYVDECRKVGGTLEVVEKETLDFVRALGQMETTSRTATGKLAEMKKTFVEISAQYKQMTDAEKASPFGKALAASLDQLKGRIQDSKSQLDDINKSINGGGGLTGALDNMLGKVGLNVEGLMKFGGAAGAATTALKVAKDAFFASETSLDEWGRTVQSTQSLYQGFLSALNNSDISGFLSRMDEIVSAARDAYNAMDELGTYSAFQQRNVAKGRAGYAQALDEYRLNPTADNKQKLQQANQKVMNDLRESHDKTEAAYQAALRQIATERISGKGMQDAFVKMFSEGNYGDLQSAKSSYKTGRGLNSGAQYYYGDRVYDGRVQDRATGKWRDMSDTEKQQFEFARALSQVNDSQIKEVQALGAQSVAITEQIYQQDRAYNRLSGNNAPLRGGGGSGGGGGRSGGGKTETIKTEEQLNNDEIQKLTQEYIQASDARQASIRQEIKVLQERNAIIQTMKDEALGKRLPVGDMDTASGIAPMELINPFEKYKDTIISIKTPLQALTEEMKNLAEAQALALTPEQWSAYQTQIEEVQKKMGTFKGDGKSTAKEWGGAAQAINAVGSAMQSIEDPAAKVAGTIAQAIATIALTYAKSLEGTFTPWDWIAAAASGAATMISVISSIHSATGYANGGIVKGNSYSGDNIPAMIDGGAGGFAGLNAGEIVLNKAAQGNLASQLQGAGMGGMQVIGEISGEKIVLVANRFFKRTGQGEIVTW